MRFCESLNVRDRQPTTPWCSHGVRIDRTLKAAGVAAGGGGRGSSHIRLPRGACGGCVPLRWPRVPHVLRSGRELACQRDLELSGAVRGLRQAVERDARVRRHPISTQVVLQRSSRCTSSASASRAALVAFAGLAPAPPAPSPTVCSTVLQYDNVRVADEGSGRNAGPSRLVGLLSDRRPAARMAALGRRDATPAL
jgi:hypothetical protein